MAISTKLLFALFIIAQLRPNVVDTQADQCSSNSGVVLQVRPDADVKFSVILTLRVSTDGQTCGQTVSPEAVQNLAVLEWTVNRLNAGNFVDGVTLGFDVYDDCAISRRSMMYGLGVADSPRLGTDECTNATTCTIGIVGTSTSTSTDSLLYALEGSPVPVVGPFATSPTLTSHYPNFYRTQLSDEQQIQAVARFLQSLGLTYIAVVTTNDTYGHFAGQRLKEVSKQFNFCIDVIQTVTTGADIADHKQKLTEQKDRAKNQQLRVVYFGSRAVARAMFRQLAFEPLPNTTWILSQHPEDVDEDFTDTSDLENGTLLIRRPEIGISAVSDYVTNKWARIIQGNTSSDEIEELMSQANLQEVPNFSSISAVPAIDSMFILAATLQRQHSLYCDANTRLCEELRKHFMISIKEMTKHSIDYTDDTIYSEDVMISEFNATNRKVAFLDSREVQIDGDSQDFILEIVKGVDLIQVASFHNGNIETTNASFPAIPTSQCNNSCPMCVDAPEVPFAYIPGESLILGLVSAHEVDPTDIFKCGQLRTSQRDVMNIENILHTVDIMKVETGIDFGIVIIDDCYSSARTELILPQILAGKLKLRKPGSDEIIDVSKFAAVVATTGSTVTIPMAMFMRELKIPVVSSAASSPDLDDRVNFPYYLRTVPSDKEQANAMVDIILKMGWEYVSVLFTKNNYGNKGKEAFVTIATAAGICVAEDPEGISDIDTESALIGVFTRLKLHRSAVVVYFGTQTLITKFLKSVGDNIPFIFLGSEDWGNNNDVLQNGGRGALGSITLNNEGNDLSDSTFEAYIQNLQPDMNTRNPWFSEYWENVFQCDLASSFNNRYPTPCRPDHAFTQAQIDEFLQDQRIVHSSDAVRVVAKGLRVAKDEKCRLENTFPCPKFFKYINDVVSYIRTQTIDRGGNEVNVFKADGNGNIGFEINNIQEVATGSAREKLLDYVKVGSYDESILTLEPANLNFYRGGLSGQCSSDRCAHCEFNTTQPPVTMPTTTHGHPVDDAFTVPDFTVIGILGFLFLVIIMIAIICCCYFKRRHKELETQLKKTTFELRTSEKLHGSGAYTNASAGSMNFHNAAVHHTTPTSPSGETAFEFQRANAYLPNGGVVNNGFVGSDMYLHARHEDHEDENQNITNSSSPSRNESPPKSVTKRHHRGVGGDSGDHYRPTSQTSYGISTHHSFKKPAEAAVKIQPRTQLNVPPCRPELPPPRDSAHAQKMNESPHKNNNHLPTAVPKDKPRKLRNHKRTTSPPAITRSLSSGSPPYKNSDYVDNYNQSTSTQFLYGPDAVIRNDDKVPDSAMINVAGSMEKISRV